MGKSCIMHSRRVLLLNTVLVVSLSAGNRVDRRGISADHSLYFHIADYLYAASLLGHASEQPVLILPIRHNTHLYLGLTNSEMMPPVLFSWCTYVLSLITSWLMLPG